MTLGEGVRQSVAQRGRGGAGSDHSAHIVWVLTTNGCVLPTVL